MRTKTYLKRIRILNAVIDAKNAELEELRKDAAMLKSMDYASIRVVSSGNQDKMADAVVRMLEITDKVKEDIARLSAERDHIIDQISALPDERYVKLLTFRYVNRKTFEEIAEEMGYTDRRIYQLHGEALQFFERFHSISGSS